MVNKEENLQDALREIRILAGDELRILQQMGHRRTKAWRRIMEILSSALSSAESTEKETKIRENYTQRCSESPDSSYLELIDRGDRLVLWAYDQLRDAAVGLRAKEAWTLANELLEWAEDSLRE